MSTVHPEPEQSSVLGKSTRRHFLKQSMKKLAKKVTIVAVIVLFFNILISFLAVKDGLRQGDIMLRFRERQTLTFVSALFLGFTSLTSLVIYLLKKQVKDFSQKYNFWLVSSIGFFYLTIDEYFMAHEGLDEGLASLFGKDIKHLNLDNLVIAGFGLLALFICLYFKKEIFLHKEMPIFLGLGSLGLLGTIVFHSFERVNVVWEVVEEACKLLGVCFFFVAFFLALLSVIKQIPSRKGG